MTKIFKVNPYITPKYELKIEMDKTNYLVGETAIINLNSKYFFGEPVSNAEYKLFIDDMEYKTGNLDEQGKSKIEYKIEKDKNYKIKVEVKDQSNYFVEENTIFYASLDKFNVELYSEYGVLADGITNDIYVLTTNTDGTPLKTYATIKSGQFTKQIATDENGIGKFSIDIDSNEYYNNSVSYKINNYEKEKIFNITVENMQGEKIYKNISLPVKKKNILVSTDKVKYNQGEDIKINVNSEIESDVNIAILKNDKLIKMITTNSGETTVNLEDTYGLIDIYVTQKYNNNRNNINYSYNVNNCSKTIFIKPEKSLNINIQTDKEEYKPGENIKISFDTTNEGNNSTDAALLVSMLDNSILNLAKNDISIDNIKLALSDIKFSDELDAATLYSCIINDNQEQKLTALLLKQTNEDNKLDEEKIINYEQKDKAIINTILLGILIAIIVSVYLCKRFPKFKQILKHLVNVIVTVVVVEAAIIPLMYDFYSDHEILTIILGIIGGIMLYVKLLSKYGEELFKTSIGIISLLIAIYGLEEILYFWEYGYVSGKVILVAMLLIVILVCIALKFNKKFRKIMKKIAMKIVKMILFIMKLIFAIIISLFIITYLVNTVEIIPYEIANSSVVVLIYILNYLFSGRKKDNNKIIEINYNIKTDENDKDDNENDKNQKNNNEEKNVIKIKLDKKSGIVLALSIFGAIMLIYFIIKGIIGFNDRFDYAQTTIDSAVIDESQEGGMNNRISSADAELSQMNPELSGSIGSTSDGFGNLVPSISLNKKESTNSSINNKIESEKVVDDNIRNVFLESMCFIPELVTSNGKANLDLKLSDNITTWTIQTVGNTKDGRVGYGSIDNIKVFKEFFVDFELPKNLVETDKVSIPVTVYNYTENTINTTLKIEEQEWFTLDENQEINISVEPNLTKMVYIPITVIKNGDFKFRAEVTNEELTDIVEKKLTILPKGYKVEKVVSTGKIEKDITEDILILDDIIENTAKAKVKIYPTTISQVVEGMDKIFRMPTGCFEQISSSLYPNILALKYMEDNKIVDNELKEKAIKYISSGYQKLLTYEVKNEKGGYSLYGGAPAETVLTAYGLMELTDLKEVYDVDENVIEKMNNYLYKKQKANGLFELTGSHTSSVAVKEKEALNAYIIWALSESNPNDKRLNKSIEYLKNKIENIDDNYTLALIANALANVKDKKANDVIKILVNNIEKNGDIAYITSNITDYYGSRGDNQTIQTTALTSMALSKTSKNANINKALINYIISKKDYSGTWYSTQATILALKALNEINNSDNIKNQTIKIKLNSEEKIIDIKDNNLSYYEFSFNNLSKENKLNIDIEKGNLYYEVIEEYYIPYDKVDKTKDDIEILVESNNELNVNDVLEAKIKVINNGNTDIKNGMVTISTPQGFTVLEESLMELKDKGLIEKYEMTYSYVNIYLRNFDTRQLVDLNIKYRALYPVEIKGLAVKAYDYYNPEIEGKTMPISIKVNK